MNTRIRALILEDRATDAELMLRQLKQHGYEPDWKRVETEEDYLAQLDQGWDIILADYNLPRFDGFRALELLRERELDIPFILVSSSIGEEQAVTAMKSGANDYIMKDKLVRLGPSVERELGDAADRRRRGQAEEALRLSEQRYRDLYDQANEGLVMMTPDGTLSSINLAFAAMHGYTVDEMHGMDISKLDVLKDTALDDRAEIICRTRAGEVVRFEAEHYHKDGHIFPLSVTVSLINIGGQPFFLAFHQDISERKQAEQDLIAAKEQAERANKLKDAFIANVSHEIRTPLNIILGYTDIIEDTFARVSTKDELRYFGAVREGSNRLMRTVDLILNTSRAVTGDITLLPTEIDLPALIGKTVRDFAHRAEEKSITLNASNLVGNITALLDENIFWQVLVNLLDNAIKYTKEGGITVELYREGEEVYLDVRDTGIGMEEEFLERLFDPYTQEQVGYTRGYEGIGLGLALTKHYLCLHQIPISVRSIKGEGTTFTLCLTGVVKTGAVSDNQ